MRALRNATHAGTDVMILSPPPMRKRKRKTREESKCAICYLRGERLSFFL
jgi:hypothetical protein